MMSKYETFSISLDNSKRPAEVFGERCLVGKIVLGNAVEVFAAPLAVWTAADYEAQWREGLERFIQGIQPTCLITAMRDPLVGSFIDTWSMYAEGEFAAFQNQIILSEVLRGRFTGRNFYDFIQPHETSSADGATISQWMVHRSAIERFLRNIQG